jgi:Adaptive response protein AidB N-terminal domain
MPPNSSEGQPKPASADSGFVLSLPPLENPFTSDAFLLRTLSCMSIRYDTPSQEHILTLRLQGYLPKETFASVHQQLAPLGDEAISDQVKEWNANAEKQLPYVKTHNAWGARYDYDKLVTGEGWRELGEWGARTGYEYMCRTLQYF